MSQQKQFTLLAVIRIRGKVNLNYKIGRTLNMLNLKRTNYMTIVPKTSTYEGMLKQASKAITWGEMTQETLEYVLRKRAELPGRKNLSDTYLKDNTKYESISSLAEAMIKGEATLNDIPELKKVFRLHPPKKGFKKIKYYFTQGGDLGYRGPAINELVVRMA